MELRMLLGSFILRHFIYCPLISRLWIRTLLRRWKRFKWGLYVLFLIIFMGLLQWPKAYGQKLKPFLALLDFVSRPTLMAQASIVSPSAIHLSVRTSSVPRFSRKPLHGPMPNFVGSSLSTISPDHFFPKFSIFKFLRFFFPFR